MAATPPRPLIGINADLLAASKTAPAQVRLHAGYFDSVVAAGGLPIILPPLNKDGELDALLDLVAGVVLTGGQDMDPRRSGLATHPSVIPMAERREMNDRALVKKVIARQLPVLGIGLGMQQLNAALGGTTHVHLPVDVPRSMPHFDPAGGVHRHIVMVEQDSQLFGIYGAIELRVNSRHHQAVNGVAPGMRVAAKSPDDVVEAIEWTRDGWFAVGVQWHPEADTASALDLQLFESLITACGGVVPKLMAA